MSEQLQQVRTLDVIEMEIRVLQDQAQRVVLGYAIETGRRLEEAKAMVEYGGWGDWLKKMGYGQSTANNLMRVFREYGSSQQSLFGGEAESQALGNLTYTKALRLLALPDQEAREAFVAEHDVENMSTRDLEQALKDAAEARAEAQAAEEARAKMEADMKLLKASAQEKDKVERDLLMTKNALKGERKEAEALRKDLQQAREELKEWKAKPVDVAVETREPTPEELEKLTADAVERARAEDRAHLASMEKRLASADGDVAAFKVHYEAWQESYNKMAGYLARIAGRDQERAGKLRLAVKAVVDGWVMG